MARKLLFIEAATAIIIQVPRRHSLRFFSFDFYQPGSTNNQTSATGTLSLSNNSINLGIYSQDASIVAIETINGATDSNITLTISNTSVIGSAVINPSSGIITITAGSTAGTATINVHPNGLGSNTSQDQIITVNVSAYASNGSGGGISYGSGTGISYGSGTGVSNISTLGSVITQPVTVAGLQMPTGLQMPAGIDLSAQYANVSGTIYDKTTGHGFATPAEFFAASELIPLAV